jgi:hypothetical protein
MVVYQPKKMKIKGSMGGKPFRMQEDSIMEDMVEEGRSEAR